MILLIFENRLEDSAEHRGVIRRGDGEGLLEGAIEPQESSFNSGGTPLPQGVGRGFVAQASILLGPIIALGRALISLHVRVPQGHLFHVQRNLVVSGLGLMVGWLVVRQPMVGRRLVVDSLLWVVFDGCWLILLD